MQESTPPSAPRGHTRRELLKMTPLAAAGLLFTDAGRGWARRAGLSVSDRVGAAAFRPDRLAPTFPDRKVTPLDRYPLNSYLVDDPGIDLDRWTLEVTGRAGRAGSLTLDTLRGLPKVVQNTRHLCVEGWDVVGNFGGVPVATFLDYVAADPTAAYLEVTCADDYYESIDMASVRHPQSLLCYEMYGQPLTRGHGAPLRLVMPIKLGYKQAKYIVGLHVTDVLSGRRGYWEDQGYPWNGGL
jgi:DMSO/TMAO reductase YedYZ molybdopterin-dependent catalytic subunit